MGLAGIRRYLATLRLAVLFAVQLWWLRRTRFLRGQRQEQAASALYARQGREFVAFATRMGGLIVKLGQFLSVRIDLLPKEYIDELSRLQDALPGLPAEQIIRVIEAELHRPLAQIYRTFDRLPVAAASLGQVHRATLPDGTPVAVKVLRPGIEKVVATDLTSLRAILRLFDRFFHLSRMIDLDVLEADFTATFTNELDYALEGRHAETFQRNLLWDMHVDIPQIFWERSSHRVLTMEYMDGVRIDDLAAIDAFGIDRHELAVNLAGVFFHMVLTDGFFHADPHPGNVFVRRDGVIQLIDFGMVGTVTDADRARYADLVMAMTRHDAMGIVRALRALGFLGPGADLRRLATMIEPYIAAIVGDVSRMYTSASVVGSMMSGSFDLTIDAATLEQMQRFIFTQPIVLPGQATFLGKALVTVVGLCLRLDPDLDLLAICGPYVAEATQAGAFEWLTKRVGDGAAMARNAVPTARRLLALAERLDDGTFELELGEAVERRLRASQQQQTRHIVRAVAALVAGAVVVLRWRRR